MPTSFATVCLLFGTIVCGIAAVPTGAAVYCDYFDENDVPDDGVYPRPRECGHGESWVNAQGRFHIEA
jgi:hypothetical protein